MKKLLLCIALVAVFGCKVIPPEAIPRNWAVCTVIQTSESTTDRLPNIPLVIWEQRGDEVIHQPVTTDEYGLASGPLLGMGIGDSPISPDYYIIYVDEEGNEAGRQPGWAHIIEPAFFATTEDTVKFLPRERK